MDCDEGDLGTGETEVLSSSRAWRQFMAETAPSPLDPLRPHESWPRSGRHAAAGPRTPPASRVCPADPTATEITDAFALAAARERPEPPPIPRRARRLVLAAILAAAGFGVCGAAYGTDVMSTQGEVPRGVSIAGVAIGGLDRPAAEERLRAALAPRLDRPIQLTVGGTRLTLDPAAAGLTMDWAATLDRAGRQPLNPLTRLDSLFGSRDVGVVTRVDRAKLRTALDAVRARADRPPVEGTIRFVGATPVVVQPSAGQRVDVARAGAELVANWASGRPIALPVQQSPVRVTEQGLRAALDDVARPAVSSPLTVQGGGRSVPVPVGVVAAALSFTPNAAGGLDPRLDRATLVDALEPLLAPTEQQATDARIDFVDDRPIVRPAKDGSGVDWDATLGGVLDVVRSTKNRVVTAKYRNRPPGFTTQQADDLGVREVIGEFRTGGFAADEGSNIRRLAEKINGTLLRPGQVFSLNQATGPRGAAQGYLPAGVIDHGLPATAVGGGASQFASTLYNAAYLAGLADGGHQPHSYYDDRFPAARDAIAEGGADLRIIDDAPTGVAIQATAGPSEITVRIWGSSRYRVESVPDPRTDTVAPPLVVRGLGEPCTASAGSPGFTTTDTRILRDPVSGREVARKTRQVSYGVRPTIVCL